MIYGFQAVMILGVIFTFVYSVIKMGIEHSEKIERMKHGYPLKDGTMKIDRSSSVIDYRGNYGNNNQQSQQ